LFGSNNLEADDLLFTNEFGFELPEPTLALQNA